MKTIIKTVATVVLGINLVSCSFHKNKEQSMDTYEKGTFGYDMKYLSSKDSLVVLSDAKGQAQVIVSPKYQAKVFTSTVDGLHGKSLGYLKYEAFEAKVLSEHMNGYGGENRIWLGPEGGKFSIYFEPGAEQVYDNWHTPKPFDIEPWQVVSSDKQSVVLNKEMQVTNYQGTQLHVDVNRSIRILEPAQISSMLGIKPASNVKMVGYATDNSIRNKNDFEWTEKTGTICIWMLDMFNTAPRSLTIVPYNEGDNDKLGKIATTDYFGEIPADRLKIKDGVLYLRTDGKCRNKLGMNALRTKAIAANYDPDSERLTITTFDVDKEGTYLNQEWNPAKDPLTGDAMNAYNDGPLEDGSMMGPFLEVESASPAAFLKPGEMLHHKHNVFHFVGSAEELTPITKKLLGVSIDQINEALK
ncbi:DUF6786 family protein [Parabacteroides pacaensis]|uniref:DUF6786 family protein n=1 Tax=Parabacteroides pacaensis TaxID=2086575 RepID=UPI000D0E7E7D|nr:DUF6786 family protein [Parabacteroides pacaensis]